MSARSSASGSAGATSALSPSAILALLVLATFAVRLMAGALAPLTEDEAYYRLWSMRPALGYFDHPPMIAWWIWLGRSLGGDSALGVRLAPILASAATTLATFDLARQLGLGARVATRASIWFNATLLMGIGGEMAVPDAPAALFWTLTLAFTFRALAGRRAWWLAAGAAAGLACLSKYSALFLAPGVLAWLAGTTRGRAAMRTPGPWLAALIAVAIFAPNIVWNAAHGWMTFAKQFGRIEASRLDPGYLPKFLADQFVLLNPMIAVFACLAVARRAALPLLVIAAPFAAYLVIHSLHDEVQGQWPAPLYPSLAIAAAAAADTAGGWLVVARTWAPRVGFAVSAFALTFLIAPSDGRLPLRDPGNFLRGWPAFDAAVEQTRTRAGAAWVGGLTYGFVAQLADDSTIHAPVAELYERQRYTFETPAQRADFSQAGLVVEPERWADEASLRTCFAKVTPWGRLDRGVGRGMTPYLVYRVSRPLRDIDHAGCVRTP